jgi:hypothetical protein
VEVGSKLPPLQVEHEKNTCSKKNGLNVWNIVLQTKYRIRLEHGKEGMSFTYKSLASKLPHHHFIVTKSFFSRFHPLT